MLVFMKEKCKRKRMIHRMSMMMMTTSQQIKSNPLMRMNLKLKSNLEPLTMNSIMMLPYLRLSSKELSWFGMDQNQMKVVDLDLSVKILLLITKITDTKQVKLQMSCAKS